MRALRLSSRAAALLLATATPLAFTACNGDKAAPAPSASMSAPAAPMSAPAASGSVSATAPAEHDESKPIYPIDVKPDPLAEKLCSVLYDRESQRREACCASKGLTSIRDQCIRTLSYSLQTKAVTVDPASIELCSAAVDKQLQGCDWVTPLSPAVPEQCTGIVRGTVEENAACRSSLECKDGLRCLSLGAKHIGACAKPLPDRALCGLAIDQLAGYVREVDVESHHPECVGRCLERHCNPAAALGADCKYSNACAAGAHCLNGKCSEKPLPPAGSPCDGNQCAQGARCFKGKCIEPKPESAACASNEECRGACVQGKCLPKCSSL
jgi:hypothetical protein